MQLGTAICVMRSLRKMTQEELGKTVRLSDSYISMLETGSRLNPPLRVVEDIAGALGVKTSELIRLAEDPSVVVPVV